MNTVPKFTLSSEERDLLTSFVNSDAWRALDKCMDHFALNIANSVLSTDAGDPKLPFVKAEYEGAKKMQFAIKNIKKELRPKS
jgi:hypothetical protein